MAVSVRAASEADFPEPHRFGVWWNHNTFVVYRNLSLVKSAVTQYTNSSGHTLRDARIYEHTGESWDLIYEIPKGSYKLDHELWKGGAAPKTLAVSEASVEAAIASIMGGMSP